LLYCTKSLFIITDHPDFSSSNYQKGDEISFLGISRESGAAREGKDSPEGFRQKLATFAEGSKLQPQPCWAVLGVLTASEEPFLLVVAEATKATDIGGEVVFEVARCDAFPFAEYASSEASASVTGVKLLLERNFYFSHDVDITRRLQTRTAGPVAMSSADTRFVWNRQIVEPLLRQSVSERYFTPVMQGFVQLRDLPSASPGARGSALRLLLVARRSSWHAGTRYNARGLNDEGEAANWVETEMLAKVPSSMTGEPQATWLSFTQVRGSAPVFWEQASSNSCVTVTRGSGLAAAAFEKHQARLAEEFGEILYVSLLSDSLGKRETEGVLTDALKAQARMHHGTHLVHLDFHARVTGEEQAFDRELSSIYTELAPSVEGFGFLEIADSKAGEELGKVKSRQIGVVRTNCFDSLDRTNLLQYQLAWRWLQKYCTERPALQSLVFGGAAGAQRFQGQTSPGASLFSALGDMMAPDGFRPEMQSVLRCMWADLGDVLSEQYTGAASTMGAALRQGGHTALAMFEKGWRSVNRAYCAHFEDSARQAALDSLLGRHRLPKAPGPPEVRRAPSGKLSVAAITWNLHGRSCWESGAVLRDLIRGSCCNHSSTTNASPYKSPDVVVFAFQEFAELTPANVVMLGSGDEAQQARFDAAALAALQDILGEPFLLVRSVGMVGLFVAVFVAHRLRDAVGGVAADRVRHGLYGQAGNKGAVAVRLEVEKTSICALSLHLESGHSADKVVQRAAQLKEALQGCFASGKSKVPTLGKHDLVIAAGDFNFRASFPEDGNSAASLRATLASGWTGRPNEAGCVGEGMAAQSPEEVLRFFQMYDELAGSRGSRKADLEDVLREFSITEGPVLFPPTYRMVEGQCSYDLERQPAWCDRILHSKVGVVRKRYCALGGLQQSDHRPVCTLIETTLLAMPGASRSPQNSPAAASSPQGNSTPGNSTPGSIVSGQSRFLEAADLLSGTPFPGTPQSAAFATPKSAASGSSPVARSPSNSGAATLDLLDFDPPVRTTSSSSSLPERASPKQAGPLPGRAASPGNLGMGTRVLAEFRGGWYLATVTRSGGGTCDVAWLRPQATQWGNKAEMARHLCSTGADETMHGDMLPLATRIRLPDGSPSSGEGSGGGFDLLG
ncbi:unnamed protein product, partial [Polarella glacialis]